MALIDCGCNKVETLLSTSFLKDEKHPQRIVDYEKIVDIFPM